MKHKEEILEEDLEVNMTPMLDIVFIMLIFFIVTAVFVKESGVDVLRPEAETTEQIKRVSILIGITEDGRVWIDKQELKLEDVRAVVEKLYQESPKGRVVIQADTQSQSGIVVAIMETLNSLGVEDVSIATQRGS